MSTKELLEKVIPYAGHKSGCGALGIMWDKHPCDCGWEKLERKLQKEGLIPLTKKCEHCGEFVKQESFPTMGICFYCSDLLCHDCLHGGSRGSLAYEPGTCHQSPSGAHQQEPPKETLAGGPGGAHRTDVPGEVA